MIRAKTDVLALWQKVRKYWYETKASGRKLYDYAAYEADVMGWELHPIMAGHRVADFPHPYPGRLVDLPNALGTHRWILEILIRHKTLPFGAYYETYCSDRSRQIQPGFLTTMFFGKPASNGHGE